MFYSRKHGKHRVPKSLAVDPNTTHSSSTGASSTTTTTASSSTQEGVRRDVVIAFSAPSYKDKFSVLVSNLPDVFGVVKDPVESSADLEEVSICKYNSQARCISFGLVTGCHVLIFVYYVYIRRFVWVAMDAK